MSKYIIRLDDASTKMDVKKWERVELLLDRYDIKPLVGIIPNCKDPMMAHYENDETLWNKVKIWKEKGWSIALHGFEHVYCTYNGGINPVHQRSEFAGLLLKEQKRKIREGIKILRAHNINPKVFFAPSHTFDESTIEALKSETDIRIISDTIANKPYTMYGMTFVPQQSGRVRRLPFNTVTFCYHPNMMDDNAFEVLEKFLEKYSKKFVAFPMNNEKRQYSLLDRILSKLYFMSK